MRIIFVSLMSLFLVACTPKATEPRIVQMPELSNFSGKTLRTGCHWETETVSVFNQRAQSVSFRYQVCEYISRYDETFIFIDTEFGGSIQESYKRDKSRQVEQSNKSTANKHIVENSFLRIWKQGPLTPADFFEMVVGDDNSCELYPSADGQYFIVKSDFRTKEDFEINPNENAGEFLARYNMYEAINGDGWGNVHSCEGLNLHIIVFVEGLVFSFPRKNSSVIDFQSITYTNSG